MVLTTCPKCQHQFAEGPHPAVSTPSPSTPSPCPCQDVAGAAPVAWGQPAAQQPTMLSLSITASGGASLNGGHVVVHTAPAPAQRISVTATLPAPMPAAPWAWTPTPSLTTWRMIPPSAPHQAPSWTTTTSSAPSWTSSTVPQPLPAWASMPATKGSQCPLNPKGSQYRLTGGGILNESMQPAPVLLQPRGKLGLLSCGARSPEQSPSTPLSFVLPGGGSIGATLDVSVEGSPESDLRLLQATTQALKASGWYYEGFSWQESAATLRNAAPGTFLVRDSSDPRFLFSLSVQTDRGPTSVRLLYIAGGFRLDAEPELAPTMPLFPCVLKLIEHYVASRGKRVVTPSTGRGREQVWVDARGQMYSHILLTAPRRHTVPGLQHLARLAVHRQLQLGLGEHHGPCPQDPVARLGKLELPPTLRRYLEEYPYTL